MIRIIIVVSVSLLVTSSILHAEDRESSLLNFGYKQRHLQRADINMSLQEYEETCSRNSRFMINTAGAYSRNALELIGIPELGIHLIGNALGVAINGARLDLNKSKTLGLELNGVANSGRALHFGVHFDW